MWLPLQLTADKRQKNMPPLKYSWTLQGIGLCLALLSIGFFHSQVRGEEGDTNPQFLVETDWFPQHLKLASADESGEPSSDKKPPKIKLGMTQDEVKAAWGEPNEVKKTLTCYGEAILWIYRDREDLGITGEKKLTFEENKLVKIE